MDAIKAADLVAYLDKAEIDMAIIFAPLYDGGPYDDPTYSLGNYAIAEACNEFPDRLIGYGRVDPRRRRAAVSEFEHCLDDYGLRGLMLHPDWEAFSPANKALMWPLAEICADRGLPISFHSGYYPRCQPMLFVPLAEEFPTVPIYLKHIGYEYWRDAIEVARHYPNVYLETAGNSTSGVIAASIREAGADKGCFGSDYPYIIPEVVLAKVRGLELSESDLALVLGGNSARINGVAVAQGASA
jgi:uncharacterized protein